MKWKRPLKQLSAQALQSPAESVCFLEMKNLGQSEYVHSLFLSIGLSSGILIRSVVDFVTGTLSDQRSRFLGAKSVRLHKVLVQGMPAMLALSAKPWVSYNFQGKYHCTPMSYEQLEFASSFASEQCPEGFVAISANTLRIVSCHCRRPLCPPAGMELGIPSCWQCWRRITTLTTRKPSGRSARPSRRFASRAPSTTTRRRQR